MKELKESLLGNHKTLDPQLIRSRWRSRMWIVHKVWRHDMANPKLPLLDSCPPMPSEPRVLEAWQFVALWLMMTSNLVTSYGTRNLKLVRSRDAFKRDVLARELARCLCLFLIERPDQRSRSCPRTTQRFNRMIKDPHIQTSNEGLYEPLVKNAGRAVVVCILWCLLVNRLLREIKPTINW